jgi:hypothetical protein
MRWTGHVACIEETRNRYTILVENLRGNSGDLGVYKRITLKWILKKWWIGVAKYLRAT